MPVAAVIGFGMPCISSGSSAAASGTSFGSMTADFTCWTGSVTTAATVTSEPVPAVVGIANSGSIGLPTLSMPIELRRRLARDRHRADDLGRVDRRAAADGEDRVAAMRAHGLEARLQHGIGRIGRDAIVHGDVDALRQQRLAQRLDQAQLHEHGVGDDHQRREPNWPMLAHRRARRTRPDEQRRAAESRRPATRAMERLEQPVGEQA